VTRRRRTTAHRARNKLLEVAVMLAFFVVMVTAILPWAAQTLVERMAP
jgi:hypothetical protein